MGVSGKVCIVVCVCVCVCVLCARVSLYNSLGGESLFPRCVDTRVHHTRTAAVMTEGRRGNVAVRTWCHAAVLGCTMALLEPIDEGIVNKGFQHSNNAVGVGPKHSHDVLARDAECPVDA
jgi:hypothetical protein